MRLQFATAIAVLMLGISTANVFSQTAKKIAPKQLPAKKINTIKKMIPGTRVLLTTDSGFMVIRLYDSTPLHRDNFIAKVNEKFFDSLMFHRVIKGFMIQGGDPNSKNAQPGEQLGMGSAPGDLIPAEFRTTLFHKKGALAAARTGNPEKASSNCQFYIVQGKKYTNQELAMTSMPAAQKAVYKTIGGTPMLDQNYTVFGEVEIGLNVIDKIANAPTAYGDRPLADTRMQMKILTNTEFDVLWKKANKAVVKPINKIPVKKKVK